MALIHCYECGKEISDMANACPHCGAPSEFEYKRSSDGIDYWYDEDGNKRHLRISGYKDVYLNRNGKVKYIYIPDRSGKRYEYDENEKLIQILFPDGRLGYCENGQFKYKYRILPDGREERYDEYDRIAQTKFPDGTIVFFDKNGKITQRKLKNGYEYWYDENGNSKHIKCPDGKEEWYDGDGNVIPPPEK
jgi:YD repeat-containing protein